MWTIVHLHNVKMMGPVWMIMVVTPVNALISGLVKTVQVFIILFLISCKYNCAGFMLILNNFHLQRHFVVCNMFLTCTTLLCAICSYYAQLCCVQYVPTMHNFAVCNMFLLCTTLLCAICSYCVQLCCVQYVPTVYNFVVCNMFLLCTTLLCAICSYCVQ